MYICNMYNYRCMICIYIYNYIHIYKLLHLKARACPNPPPKQSCQPAKKRSYYARGDPQTVKDHTKPAIRTRVTYKRA